MAVTRLKRKNRKNKTVSRLATQAQKLNRKLYNSASPYKGQSGVIIEE